MGHFRPILALSRASKKEAFLPPKNTKITPLDTPKKEKFLLHSNRKTTKNKGVQTGLVGLDQINPFDICRTALFLFFVCHNLIV